MPIKTMTSTYFLSSTEFFDSSEYLQCLKMDKGHENVKLGILFYSSQFRIVCRQSKISAFDLMDFHLTVWYSTKMTTITVCVRDICDICACLHVTVCVCVLVFHLGYGEPSEENLWESVLSLYHVSFRGWTPVVGHSSKYLYLQIHLDGLLIICIEAQKKNVLFLAHIDDICHFQE